MVTRALGARQAPRLLRRPSPLTPALFSLQRSPQASWRGVRLARVDQSALACGEACGLSELSTLHRWRLASEGEAEDSRCIGGASYAASVAPIYIPVVKACSFKYPVVGTPSPVENPEAPPMLRDAQGRGNLRFAPAFPCHPFPPKDRPPAGLFPCPPPEGRASAPSRSGGVLALARHPKRALQRHCHRPRLPLQGHIGEGGGWGREPEAARPP